MDEIGVGGTSAVIGRTTGAVWRDAGAANGGTELVRLGVAKVMRLFCLVRDAMGESEDGAVSSLSVSRSLRRGMMGAGWVGSTDLEMGSRMSARTLLSCS